jgi:non-heme chloroperoxidase
VLYGEDDQILPIDDSARLSASLLKHGRLKTYLGLPHDMLKTHTEVLNTDLLVFVLE